MSVNDKMKNTRKKRVVTYFKASSH